ncbi:MAG: cobalamin-dependent protein [Firmicutes bacterium]|nr:cobalamin-dependent protein [Bacillota bacterium]
MKVLLTTLNSKYVHSNLALKYLYSKVKKLDLGLDMTHFEYTINNDKSYVYTEILRGGYDLVCFSCYIWNIEQIKELGENLKKACPQMKILLGGPEVSHETYALMEANPWIDYVLRGEGEGPFSAFCQTLASGSFDFSAVEGMSFR